MKKVVFVLLGCMMVSLIKGQTITEKTSKSQSFKAGGIDVQLPLPDSTFVEISKNHRQLVALFVPESNRLISAYVLQSELPLLAQEESEKVITQMALVEVPKAGEYVSYEKADFEKVVRELQNSLDDISSVINETEEQFNTRMKGLDIPNMKIDIEKPVLLGSFFTKKDAASIGMLMSLQINDEFLKMGTAILLIRVKKRLLFVYLYAEYKNENTLVALRRLSEKWTDEILNINAQ